MKGKRFSFPATASTMYLELPSALRPQNLSNPYQHFERICFNLKVEERLDVVYYNHGRKRLSRKVSNDPAE
jgi:hypothetical protein